MDPSEITKYKDMALRRKYLIIIPFLLSVLAGLGYFLIAPRIYEAETLILVQPQSVPEQYVLSIVSRSVEDRLRMISQQITSRTNLEKIIEDYLLVEYRYDTISIDKMVLSLRKRIKVNVRGGGRNKETSA